MKDKLIIEGIAGYEGEYEFELSSLTNRELHTIKRISGIRAGELADAFFARDTDLVVACAVVALQQAGKPVIEDMLWDAEGGSIRLILGSDDSPPATAAPQPPNDDEPSNDGETSKLSGEPSASTSESLETTP